MIKELAFSTYHEIIAWELRGALRRYYEVWEGVLEKGESERDLLASTVELPRVSIVVLSCALVEYVINFYLCTRCDAKRFGELDRRSLFDKWTKVPKEFAPTYVLAGGSDLAKDLSELIARRKSIVHAKPYISVDGDNRHKGNEPSIVADEHAFVGRCATLPFRLVEHLLKYEPAGFMELFSLRDVCGGVAWGFETGQRRVEVTSRIPRELISEIMQQGHDRETARRCAIMIGDRPKVDEGGHVVVWLGAGKEVRLKPLRFFEAKKAAAIG